MKLAIHFFDEKEDVFVTEVQSVEGQANFLELLLKGVKNNETLTLTDHRGTITKEYKDVKSIEILLHE